MNMQNHYEGKVIRGVMLLEKLEKLPYGNGYFWKMKCLCGNEFKAAARFSGKYFSNCGCVKDKYYYNKALEKVGLKYKYLTVKALLRKENKHHIFLMKCKCGKTFEKISGHHFKEQSCGCIKPHSIPKNDKAASAKLKNHEVISMRELHTSGLYSIKDLAEMFNLSENYVSRIVKKHIWKHL